MLPVDDFGVQQGFRLAYGLKEMPAPKLLAMFGERWAPHRSAADLVSVARGGSVARGDCCRHRYQP